MSSLLCQSINRRKRRYVKCGIQFSSLLDETQAFLPTTKWRQKCKGGKQLFCAKNRISKGETPKKQVGNAIGGRIACKDFSQTYQIFCLQIHAQVFRRINFKCAAIKWFEKQEEAKLIWADGMTLTLPERSKDSFMMKPSLWNLFSSILTMAEN